MCQRAFVDYKEENAFSSVEEHSLKSDLSSSGEWTLHPKSPIFTSPSRPRQHE